MCREILPGIWKMCLLFYCECLIIITNDRINRADARCFGHTKGYSVPVRLLQSFPQFARPFGVALCVFALLFSGLALPAHVLLAHGHAAHAHNHGVPGLDAHAHCDTHPADEAPAREDAADDCLLCQQLLAGAPADLPYVHPMAGHVSAMRPALAVPARAHCVSIPTAPGRAPPHA
jgi:hypothetical protein